MKLEITTKNNYRVTNRLEEILDEKIKKLDRYFPDKDTLCKVVMTDLGRQSKMEVSINYFGQLIRAEVVGNTMYYNIDEILPKLERQIAKHHDKLSKKKTVPKQDFEYQYVSDVDLEPVEIAKTKRFLIDSLTVLEAADSLELVGHDFYLFENIETGNVEAVYLRKDGTIGHLQPYKK